MRIHVLHLGSALEPEFESRARDEQQSNPRYSWLGGLPREQALRVLARCRLMVLSSTMEGGANVISEALVHGVPVLASRIPGSIGLLGHDYPGYFTTGDTDSLAELLRRAETDSGFYAELADRARKLAPRFTPDREREGWRRMLEELTTS